MPRGVYVRTPEFRRAQSEARRADGHARAAAAFFAAAQADTPDEAGRRHLLTDLARQCVVTAPSGPEHARWEKWLDALERGCAVAVMAAP